jgi:hypothetical protein
MRRVFGNWLVAINDSFTASNERGALVFRQSGKEVWIWHDRIGEGVGKAEAIQTIKAQANSRYDTLLESDECGVYRWAYKHPEEYEAVSPNRYRIDFFAVVDHEYLSLVVEHRSAADGRWAWELVQSVAFQWSG